jgi:hypothetical protein
LIRAAIERMPDGSRILAATDNDASGRDLAALIGVIVRATGRGTLIFKADLPEEEGADWNDCLCTGSSRPVLERFC